MRATTMRARRAPAPALASALALACLSCLAVGAARAQYTYADNPPEVRVYPSAAYRSGPSENATVTVTVDWCDDANIVWDFNGAGYPSRTLLLNDADVSASFTHGFWGATTSCPNFQRSTGTVTLRPGENYLVAVMTDQFGSRGVGVGTYVYEAPPVVHGVVVTADAGALEVGPNALYPTVPAPPAFIAQARYTVRNTGAALDTFTLAASCAGAAIDGCGLVVTRVVLDPAQATTVTVGYNPSGQLQSPGAAVGRTGELWLRAGSLHGGVTKSAWTYVTLAAPPGTGVVLLNPGGTVERDLCLTMPAGPDAAYECGTLRLTHPLPSVRTLNKVRAPTLVYSSAHTRPAPLVQANVTLPPDRPLPSRVEGRLLVGGVQYGSAEWLGGSWGAPGATRRVVVGFYAPWLSTGALDYTFQARAVWADGGTATYEARGTLLIVNRSESAFGAGWWLAGLERLYVIDSSRLLWVGGDGSARLYARSAAGANTWRGPALDRPDSLVWDAAAGLYARALPNGARVLFDGQGNHLRTVSRLGHITHFWYDPAGPDGAGRRPRLEYVTVPGWAAAVRDTYTFLYDSATGRLRSVASPGAGAARVTSLFGSAGRATVDSIRDPDGTVVRFGYSGGSWYPTTPIDSERVQSRTDRRGNTTTYAYNGSQLLIRHQRVIEGGMAIGATFSPAETRGSGGGPGSGIAAAPLDSAYTLLDGPRSDVADVTKFWVDRFGAPTRVRDPLGRETLVERDTAWPALASWTRSASGLESRAWYNARGLVDSSTVYDPLGTGQDATTRYSWHGTWDLPTRVVSPTADTAYTDYDALGNPLWQQAGGSAARRVSFSYHTSGPAAGMLSAVTAPLTGPSSVYYDGRGNLAATRSPTGILDSVFTDAVGRDTLATFPLDESGAVRGRTRTVYDVSDQVTESITWGPAVAHEQGGLPADSVRVVNEYDPEGNLKRVTKLVGVASQGVDGQWTRYFYDRANRKVHESVEGVGTSYDLDPAGNVRSYSTARGYAITMEYDALNRLTRRITPPASGPPVDCSAYITLRCGFALPTREGPLPCSAADTAVFEYDVAGDMLRADNADARVRRAYYPNGLLASEALAIRGQYNNAPGYCRQYAPEPPPPPPGGGGGGGPGGGGCCISDAGGPARGSSRFARLPRVAPGWRHLFQLTGSRRLTPTAPTSEAPFPAPGMDADFVGRSYALGVAYDLGGRRTSVSYGGGTTRYYYTPGVGALDSVADQRDQGRFLHRFRYDDAGRLVDHLQPGSVRVHADYDGEGRRWGKQVYQNEALLYRDTVAFDQRGRARAARSGLTLPNTANNYAVDATTWYGGLGAVAAMRQLETPGDLSYEGFVVDALGNRRSQWRQGDDARNIHDLDRRRVLSYDLAGRLTRLASPDAADTLAQYRYEETREYDQSGNQTISHEWERSYQGSDQLGPSGAMRDVLALSFYGADEKLRIYNRHNGYSAVSDDASATPATRGVYEEYRYDALGRRVMTRARHDASSCPSTLPGCETYTQRVQWDGAQVATERRTEGRDSATADQIDSDQYAEVVTYVHAGGIDAPLAVWKGSRALAPHANWRGSYVFGTWYAGGTDPGPNGNTIAWPGREMTVDRGRAKVDGLTGWWGSLLREGTDGSGLQYMRNRYYDPRSGRFTQQDPVGLAGGLNLYGFGGSDPVNASDPFGLCPVCDLAITAASHVRYPTPLEGQQTLVSAISSGEWTYSQYPSGMKRDPSTPLPGERLGDCTDFCRHAVRTTFNRAWSSGEKASTSMFKAGNHPGFVEVGEDEAQTGDVVVQGGHAGVFIGSENGNTWGWANNGAPTKSDGSGYLDRPTGARKFNNGSFGSGDPRFFRPVIWQ